MSHLPDKSSANYALAVLLLAYVFSFIDRNILALLIGPIKTTFGISDFEFSLLHGWAFTFLYIFLGIPFGWLADRYNRRRIITIGVLLWTVMTCGAGWAESFWALFWIRVGVGIGEASLSPAAYSMLADYFPPDRLRWATSIFTLGITLGSGLSYAIGGLAYNTIVHYKPHLPSWAQGFAAWQMTMVAVGLPGLIIVLLLAFVKEPFRSGPHSRSPGGHHLIEVFKHYHANRHVYWGLVTSVSLLSVVGYGFLAWIPEFLVRSYAIPRQQAGTWAGLILMTAGSLGALSGASLSGWLQRCGYRDANPRAVAIVAATAGPFAMLAPFMPTSVFALFLIAPVFYLHYAHFGIAMAALQEITPSRMRAITSAFLLFFTNFFGLACGGTLVAVMTDFIFSDDHSLRYSLSLTAALTYPLAAMIVRWILPSFRKMQIASLNE